VSSPINGNDGTAARRRDGGGRLNRADEGQFPQEEVVLGRAGRGRDETMGGRQADSAALVEEAHDIGGSLGDSLLESLVEAGGLAPGGGVIEDDGDLFVLLLFELPDEQAAGAGGRRPVDEAGVFGSGVVMETEEFGAGAAAGALLFSAEAAFGGVLGDLAHAGIDQNVKGSRDDDGLFEKPERKAGAVEETLDAVKAARGVKALIGSPTLGASRHEEKVGEATYL